MVFEHPGDPEATPVVRVKGGEKQQHYWTAFKLVFKQKSKAAQPIK